MLYVDKKSHHAGTVWSAYAPSREFVSNIYLCENKDTEYGDQPHTASGMLLYARTDENAQPNNAYHMSGNSISLQTLNLAQSFKDIAASLDNIVAEYFVASEC